jgi:hypothetical protein
LLSFGVPRRPGPLLHRQPTFQGLIQRVPDFQRMQAQPLATAMIAFFETIVEFVIGRYSMYCQHWRHRAHRAIDLQGLREV